MRMAWNVATNLRDKKMNRVYNSLEGSVLSGYKLVHAYRPKLCPPSMPHAISSRIPHTRYIVSY